MKKAEIITLTLILTIITTIPILSINPTFEAATKTELLIKFKPGVSEKTIKMLTSLGLEIRDKIPQINVFIVSATQKP
jgi:hypothetical protein